MTSDFYAIIHEKKSCISNFSKMARHRLPPLKSLVYFEAAARLQSFTRASRELNMTQGAISRQVRQLEEFLGRDLFTRANRQVILTDAGHDYYVSVAHLLQQLADATCSLTGPNGPEQVTLMTSGALASMYLLPRIPGFRQQHGRIHIRIVARDHVTDLDKIDCDLALYYSRVPPGNGEWIPLFGETVFPVCSPDYFAAHRRQFQTNQALSNNLIWLESPENWINWPEWFQKMNIRIDSVENRFLVNHYSMVVQAAIAGQGIALAWSHLIDEELNQGSLVRPTKLALRTDARFYLILPVGRTPHENTLLFRDWLLANR